jgi:hypothetical protein
VALHYGRLLQRGTIGASSSRKTATGPNSTSDPRSKGPFEDRLTGQTNFPPAAAAPRLKADTAIVDGPAARIGARCSIPDDYILSAQGCRHGRIFFEYFRNGHGTTAIGTYSPRGGSKDADKTANSYQ